MRTVRPLQILCINFIAIIGLGLNWRGPFPFVPNARGQAPATQAQRQTKLDRIVADAKIPGLIAGSFESDGGLDLLASGIRKQAEDSRLKPSDRMHLGSCTKAMTASLIGMLVDQGKLKWESTLGDLFPDEKELMESGWASTTVDELVRHRSGAPANPPWGLIHKKHPLIREARREVLRWMSKQPLPKEKTFLYSNTGYCIAGHIIEVILNQSWEEVIAERLFQPLSMHTAGFGAPLASSDDQVPWGHRVILGVQKPMQADNPPPLGPAGTVHANLEDWAKFLRWQLREPTSTSPDEATLPVLTEATWKRLHQPREGEDYAGGWIHLERPWAGGKTLYHNGSNTYWYCVVFMAPAKGYGVFAASNIASPEAMQACDKAVQLFIR